MQAMALAPSTKMAVFLDFADAQYGKIAATKNRKYNSGLRPLLLGVVVL
jgi:hypothetical protein